MKREKRPARRGELTPLTPADREKLQVASPAQAQLEEMSSELIQAVSRAGDDLQRYYVRLARAAEEEEPREQLDQDVEREIQSLRRTSANLRGAWRDTAAMEDELSARFADMRTSRDKKWYLPNPPSNAAIDLEEQERNHFARGINLYKILLVCFVGSFAGVVIEMLWCLIRNSYIESRAGLVYGPFNLLYGVGAVAVTVALYRFRNRGQWLSFLGGMAAGSIVEYVCSWGQEFFFGSRSWDYSNLPFNLNGRICLLYSVFWGVLGVLWIKNIYPRMAKVILRIPNRAGKILTWCLTAFLVFNAVMSFLAVDRWSQRVNDVPAPNAFWEFIDDRFPDERMEKIFANMHFGDYAELQEVG